MPLPGFIVFDDNLPDTPAMLGENNAFTGANTHAGVETFNGSTVLNGELSGTYGAKIVLTDTAQTITGVKKFGDGTNYTTFDSTGHQTMVAGARPWRDQLGDVLNLKVLGTGISENTTDNTVEFTTATDLSDYLYTNVQLNHDRDLISDIHPHIHWFQDNEFAPNFLLHYRWQINGGSKMTEWIALGCNTTAFARPAGSTIHQICYAAGITATTNTAISDILQFRILRDNNNDSGKFTGADPYPATVGVLSFDNHFQINSLGSTDKYVK